MEMVAPLGPVYQAGTLPGNPMAMRAGLAETRIPGQVNVAGSLLTVFFADRPVRDDATAQTSDCARFAAFFLEMLDRGIFLPPSQFEALFVSAAHTDADIDATLSAARSSSLQSPDV
jgi:glutamate-1-semialdehyde 2,1-aminomutase